MVEIARILQVVFGIGLVIFVHELGHFLAARRCGVRVDVFSLGFGPRLFGWKRGATTYQVAAFPLGGFVKMAGDENMGQRSAAPDELGSKTVGQRFLIFSGGVIMNVVFGLVVFPILFAIGVPFDAPITGPPVPGSPAWHARIPAGTRILSVNGEPVRAFMDVYNDVALGEPAETALEILPPGASEPQTLSLVPERAERSGLFEIGVTPGLDPDLELRVAPGSPAERAGLRSGDRLVRVAGALPGLSPLLALRLVLDEGKPATLVVERDGLEVTATITPELEPVEDSRLVGIGPTYDRIEDVRRGSPAEALGVRPGDRLAELEGRPMLRDLDVYRALDGKGGPLRLRVVRGEEELELVTPPLEPAARTEWVGDLAIGPDLDGRRLVVSRGSAAEQAGLADGDEVRRIDGVDARDFRQILERTREAVRRGRPITLSIVRRTAGEETRFLDFTVAAREVVRPDYGLNLLGAEYVYRAKNPLEALAVGLSSTWQFLEEAWLTVKGMLFQRVGADKMGGIITISVVAHSWAEVGWTKFFFFLCLLSLNLAFLNVLPIPLLDGGHLLFLLIEKIKGSPVSERVMGYSQLIGLVLIGVLFVYVIFNDIQRVL